MEWCACQCNIHMHRVTDLGTGWSGVPVRVTNMGVWQSGVPVRVTYWHRAEWFACQGNVWA